MDNPDSSIFPPPPVTTASIPLLLFGKWFVRFDSAIGVGSLAALAIWCALVGFEGKSGKCKISKEGCGGPMFVLKSISWIDAFSCSMELLTPYLQYFASKTDSQSLHSSRDSQHTDGVCLYIYKLDGKPYVRICHFYIMLVPVASPLFLS
jgi:hypothetical protein